MPLPSSPTSVASVGLSGHGDAPGSPTRLGRTPFVQVTRKGEQKVFLELEDGQVYQGFSFGAEKNVSGELVFQTGMVGYPESITDPSYRGQILVFTFPLVGNYGVPSRSVKDEILGNLPKYFESSEIHIAGLVTASYSGEEFSHHLAQSSLGTWLKENGVPAVCGVDTRALTKQIRERGTMLGRMLHQNRSEINGERNGDRGPNWTLPTSDWRAETDPVDWIDQNSLNLVRDGEIPSRDAHSDSQ